jgi:hypothetical protein
MAFPQLTGRSSPVLSASSGRPVIVAIALLAVVIAAATWRSMSKAGSGSPGEPTAFSGRAANPAAVVVDRALVAEHAEQQLVNAQEQLTQARRLLSALSPQLTRTYLQFEKRRADAAWSACDAAQRAIEQAIGDIRSLKEKE